MELKPATAEARLVELAVLRVFAALWGFVDYLGEANDGSMTDNLGGCWVMVAEGDPGLLSASCPLLPDLPTHSHFFRLLFLQFQPLLPSGFLS